MKNLIRRCCLLILLPVFAAQAESARVALVIGNAAYESSALKNPVNDAERTYVYNSQHERLWGMLLTTNQDDIMEKQK